MIPENDSNPLNDVIEALRSRILRAVQGGTLQAGDRLPSARDLVSEFQMDHRVILAAYRHLSDEGLVEIKPRGGIYVASSGEWTGSIPPLPQEWFADILMQGLARDLAAPDLHEWMRRCTETLRLRVAVITQMPDQASGLCRELRDDFGLDSDCLLVSELDENPSPLILRRADLLITTEANAERVTKISKETGKPAIVISVRPDIIRGEWALLLRRQIYLVVATEDFGKMALQFFADMPGVENIRIVVFGSDDVSVIPDDAPVYIVQNVRMNLKGTRIPGRILPAARTISMRSAKEIFGFIIRANVEALQRLGR